MLTIIIFLPLIAAGICGAGRLLGVNGVKLVSPMIMALTVITSVILFLKTNIYGKIYTFNLGCWIKSGLLSVAWQFSADSLTAAMIVVVTVVSFIVHFYSTDYMLYDPHLPRFLAYLSLFTHFMLVLITADNLIVTFLGWEGVGLCSYLLISFWYTRVQANKSAIKALLVNRISDFAFTLGILTVFYVFQSLDFAIIFAMTPFYINKTILFLNLEIKVIALIGFLLFIGAMGKSAQLGLHTWLPDAMEGPTPVSALIHAATMVTAGVFLVIKCSPLFEYISSILVFITIIGACTAFFAASIGLVQSDIKKVIAYSTCSQLGYMFFICGLSGYNIALFHLINHAFFKALLFLSAGAIIHAVHNEQDVRRYGGLLRILPFTYIMMIIGSFSLMGFPFLTGYYSKDLILEFAFARYTLPGTFAYWLGTITAFLTAFYSLRIIYLTFMTRTNLYKKICAQAEELPYKMALSLGLLALGSIFFGYVSRDLFVGMGYDFWNTSIMIHPENNNFVDTEFIPLFVKLFPLGLTIVATVFVWALFHDIRYINKYLVNTHNNKYFINLHTFLTHKWYFDIVYNKIFNRATLNIGYTTTFKFLDKGIVEVLGPWGLSSQLYSAAIYTNKWQTGQVYFYAQVIFFALFLGIGIAGIIPSNQLAT